MGPADQPVRDAADTARRQRRTGARIVRTRASHLTTRDAGGAALQQVLRTSCRRALRRLLPRDRRRRLAHPVHGRRRAQFDCADSGTELVESFVPACAPSAASRGIDRLRAEDHYRVQAGYLGLYMLPWNRRRYRLPSALPGIILLLLRSPLIVALELARRISPGVDRRWQRANLKRWESWLQWQSAGKAATFEAVVPLRR